MTLRLTIRSMVALWLLFALITVGLPAHIVFHCLNAIILSAGLTVMWVWLPAAMDAWRNRDGGVTTAHWLTFGILAYSFGTFVRLVRWYFTNEVPSDGIEQWTYNLGLWISVTGCWFLVAAVVAETGWDKARVAKLFTGFSLLAFFLMLVEYFR